MKIKELAKFAEKFLIDNSPGILTGLGVAGSITTTVLAGKAAYSSAFLIQQENMIRNASYYEEIDGRTVNRLGARKTVELVWKEYIPTAIALTATVTSIIMANQVSTRRAAAITAAFKLSEQMSEEYREKVLKTLGHKKEEEVRAELAADRTVRTPLDSGLLVVSGSKTLFFDEISGRYFESDIETVRKSVNEINYEINNHYSACLSDFYEKIGLPSTDYSNEIGWNADELLDVRFSAIMVQDKAVISINYNKVPIRGFDRVS